MRSEFHFTLLNVGYIEPNEEWNWQNVYSPFARMYYIVDGNARVIIEGKTYELQPRKLYLIPPFTLHHNECDGLFHHYYIHFYEKTNRKESIFDRYTFPLEIDATGLNLRLVERLLSINPERYLKNIDPQEYDNPHTISHYIADNTRLPLHTLVETQGILSQLVSSFFRDAAVKTNDKDPRVVKCLQYIHENIDRDITVEKLANIACVSDDHFIRIFKANVNHTPLQYINLKKIEYIQLQLISTDASIQDIAYRLSIDNISYFNRLFKQHTGVTPGEYRKRHKNG